ncbi:tautomerase PptA [Streptomyces spiroverticillatus]|uniref:Tautomerase PptA n=1 Tax=Streptomyces finlayi TaxID=67296 RepID=A0A918WVU2_9ACTN|nr:tautomerase family protein [Streptomyces finlayi]GHA02690.1 tautomerase PptA [Streptomyces spiroverticillatus]GHC86914.1 tautomerase PptA [Streptomyces finlayi]
MPHIDLSHFPVELNEAERERLASDLTSVIVEHFGTYEGAVSIALHPVPPEAWDERVVGPLIAAQEPRLIKAPAYRPV